MKKVIILAMLVVTSFASCKKDHVCTCITDGSSNPSVITYTKCKKSDARSQCLSHTNSGSVTTCTLK